VEETSWGDKTRPNATEIVNKQPRVSNKVKIRSAIFALLLAASGQAALMKKPNRAIELPPMFFEGADERVRCLFAFPAAFIS
jgi:hypothetical protein